MEFLGATQTAYKGCPGEHMWPPAMHSLHCFEYRDSLIILNHASLQVECYRQGFSEVNFTCVHGGYVQANFLYKFKKCSVTGGFSICHLVALWSLLHYCKHKSFNGSCDFRGGIRRKVRDLQITMHKCSNQVWFWCTDWTLIFTTPKTY